MADINIRKILNSFSQNNYNRQSSAGTSAGNTSANTATGNAAGGTAGTSANSSANAAANASPQAAAGNSAAAEASQTSNRVPMDTSSPKFPANTALSNWGSGIKTASTLKLNVLQNSDRASYLKEALDLPKNMNEFIYMVQKNLTGRQVQNVLQSNGQQTAAQQMHPKTISNIQSQILSQQAYIKEANSAKQNILQNRQNIINQTNNSQNGLPSQTGFAAQTGANQARLSGQIIQQDIRQNVRQNNIENLRKQVQAELTAVDSEIQNAEDAVETAIVKELQTGLKKLDIRAGEMINLGKISQLIQKNGKNAITKIIMSMTEASKSGISDLTQMKETAKFINASIAIAAEENPQKTLKLFMLLYLPWLPLEEGVGFDIEIEEHKNGSGEESDSILVITVTTINYGTVKAILILETSNSVQVTIESSEKFPKKELRLRIEKEQTFYSMEAMLNFKTDKNIKQNPEHKQSASVNMSQTTEINPFLLLMAHALIKHIIEIDNNTTLGLTSHEDKF